MKEKGINITIDRDSYQTLKGLKEKTGISIIKLCETSIRLLDKRMQAKDFKGGIYSF